MRCIQLSKNQRKKKVENVFFIKFIEKYLYFYPNLVNRILKHGQSHLKTC